MTKTAASDRPFRESPPDEAPPIAFGYYAMRWKYWSDSGKAAIFFAGSFALLLHEERFPPLQIG